MVYNIHIIVFQITNLVEYVKRAFKDYLLRKIWMDPTTKQHAEEKVDVECLRQSLFTLLFIR